MSDALHEKRCLPCEGGVTALEAVAVTELLKKIDGWQAANDNREIVCRFPFKNFYHTMAFVNAIAWISNIENHHPDLEVSYNYCIVHFTTHAIGGLSENDFICAAKVNALFKEYKKG